MEYINIDYDTISRFRQALAPRVLVIVGMSDSIYIELTTEIVGNKGAILIQDFK